MTHGDLSEQHYPIMFCVPPRKTVTETYADLTRAFGEDPWRSQEFILGEGGTQLTWKLRFTSPF